METLLICLLLLYNTWLVTYILFGRRKKRDTPPEERPQAKPPKDEDGIVGKSRFKMESRTPISAKPESNTSTSVEGEDITDIAATFADEEDETPSARLPDDKLDEAFTDIRISDVPVEYVDDDGREPTPAKRYATGASFEEIGEAIKVADNPTATPKERKQAGQVFSEMEGNELFNRMIESSPDRAKRITGLMDEILNQPIFGEGEAVKVSVQPQNKTEVEIPADISGFDIGDFV